MKKLVLLLMICMASMFLTAEGQQEKGGDAKAYPLKEITFVIPFNAGGGTDLAARIFLKTLDKYLDVSTVATNVTGAAGTVGAQHVLDSKADGYTFLVSYAGYPIPNILGNVEWTYENFTPIAKFSQVDNTIVVQNESSYNSIMDLVDAAKAQPGEVKVGAGIGTMAHFGLLAIQKEAGVKLKIVDVGGSVPKAPELLAGRVEGYFDPIISCAKFLQGGQFKSLGIYSDVRNAMFPEIKTFSEQGLDIMLPQHYGIWAPRNVPAEVIETMNIAIEKACNDPELKKDFNAFFVEPSYTGHEDYISLLKIEYAYLAALGKDLNK